MGKTSAMGPFGSHVENRRAQRTAENMMFFRIQSKPKNVVLHKKTYSQEASQLSGSPWAHLSKTVWHAELQTCHQGPPKNHNKTK
jgi:hypothetical protein